MSRAADWTIAQRRPAERAQTPADQWDRAIGRMCAAGCAVMLAALAAGWLG